MKKSISVIAVILSMMMLVASCGKGSGDSKPSPTPASTPNPELVKNTINATIEIEDLGEIKLELYPDLAPETVENFVELAEDGFYDGTIFHRVIEDFMIQGGGYDENLKQKKTSTIKGEFAANGFENTLSHVRGVISMARAQDMDSASSQFFIVQQDATYLDGQYAAFGRVTEGMDVVDDIAAGRTGSVSASGMEDVPVDQVVIETITIDSGSSSSKSSKSKATSTPKSSKNDDEDDDDTKETSKPSSNDDDDDDKSTPRPTSKSSGSSSNKSSSSDDEDDLASFFNQSGGSI